MCQINNELYIHCMKKLILLGSTGSIGTLTLDYVRENRDKFRVVGMSCKNDIEKLKKQILEFQPEIVCVFEENEAETLRKWTMKEKLSVMVASGIKGLFMLAEYPGHMVVNALSGEIGIEPTLFAVKSGKAIAMACKEALVSAGKPIMRAVSKAGVYFIPIDSEMSGIFQILLGRRKETIEKIILTCSGGPLYDLSKEELKHVTREQVLAHPNWPRMGEKNLVDSATLVNKGLEVIEAMHLFDIPPEKIEVLIHRESIVHAMVQFTDGSVIAHMGEKDMRIPIAYALNYPYGAKTNLPRLDFSNLDLHFEKPDMNKWNSLRGAYESAKKGGNAPREFCRMHADNAENFLNGNVQLHDLLNCSGGRIE